MTLIDVIQEQRSKCPLCDEDVIVATSRHEREILLEVGETVGERRFLLDVDNGVLRARYHDEAVLGWRPHFISCAGRHARGTH